MRQDCGLGTQLGLITCAAITFVVGLAGDARSAGALTSPFRTSLPWSNGEPITKYEVEQRARFLGLSTNAGEQGEEVFEEMVQVEPTKVQLRALQQEVIRANPGKSREELVAIFRERQKQFGMALQKQALDRTRAVMLPRLQKDAREELIDERLKLQAAKKAGIMVSEDDVKALVNEVAGRNKMTYEAFAQHLRTPGEASESRSVDVTD